MEEEEIPKGIEYKIEISIGELAQRGAWIMDDVKINIFKMSSILQGLTGIDKEIWADKMAEMRHQKLKKAI
jgi:ribosomal protein L6P/L9E